MILLTIDELALLYRISHLLDNLDRLQIDVLRARLVEHLYTQ